MKEKQLIFRGQTEEGIFCRPLFSSLDKTASALDSWETGSELRKVLASITPEMRKANAYVLVNALGAGEYFGSNINADHFPWNSLAHEGDDYGYKTFLNAHCYTHHANKDPTRAIGKPIASLLNSRMKRVELVIEINREKARLEGADGIVTRVDNGEFPDVSMGARVPYDRCSICDHKSKTRDDYCEHMRPPPELRGIYGPNRILPDGRRIFVYNDYPRFFDISFVFIGADKTAKVMTKLAQRGNQFCMGPVCSVGAVPVRGLTEYPIGYYDIGFAGTEKTASMHYEDGELCGPCGGRCASCSKRGTCHTEKVAAAFIAKTSSHKKLSEIIKQVPTGSFALKRLPALESSEPDIPKPVLDALSDLPLDSVLSGSTGLGMLLKPAEFQRITLIRMGETDLADKLDEAGHTFKTDLPPSYAPLSGDLGSSARSLLPLLGDILGDRTAFGAPLKIRIMIVKRHNPIPTPTEIDHPLLNKIGSVYSAYRRSCLEKIAQAAQVVESDYLLREAVLGESLGSMFSKTANSSKLVDLDSVTYLMSAYLKDRGLNNSAALCEKIAALNPGLLDEPTAEGI